MAIALNVLPVHANRHQSAARRKPRAKEKHMHIHLQPALTDAAFPIPIGTHTDFHETATGIAFSCCTLQVGADAVTLFMPYMCRMVITPAPE